MKKQFTLVFGCIFLIVISILFTKVPTNSSNNRSFFAFDTIISLTGYGKNAGDTLGQVESEILSMENNFSRTLPQSPIYKLNHSNGAPLSVSSDLIDLLKKSQNIYTETQGIFDITIAPAADLWGFTKDSFYVPTTDEITDVQSKVGIEHLKLSSNTVQLDPGSEIDLGGIAKGYALEQIQSLYKNQKIKGGIANLGGDILAYGSNKNHSPWKIAIRTPDSNEKDILGILSIHDKYILTSGGYERYFEENGKTYQHIIDPTSCAPAKSTLRSATIITSLKPDFAVTADALATAFIIIDVKKAIEFWRTSSFPFEMILVDDTNHVYITEGIHDYFTPQDSSIYKYTYLKKSS